VLDIFSFSPTVAESSGRITLW